MITIKQISITSQGIIPLGKQGEGEVLEILFPQSSELMEESWELNHRRATDRSAYPVPLEKRGNNLVWTVTRGDTEIPGRGEAELTCYGETGQVLKSRTYGTSVAKSVTTGGEVPDPVRPWYEDILDKLHQAGGSTVKSVNGVAPDASGNVEIEVGSGGSGAPGEDGGYYTPTVTQQSSGTMQVTYTPSDTSMPAVPAVDIALPVGPQGPTGKDGSPGKDGATGSPGKDGGYYTPTVTQQSSGTMQVTYTPSDTSMPAVPAVDIALPVGPQGPTGKDGSPGKDGATGSPGKDGVTPTIGSNGNWYIGDTDTGKPSRGATGPAGKTPVKGTDYWTEADRAEIVEAVLEQMGASVIGSVDENNVITLTGDLAGGTYTLKYELEDGTKTTIGSLVLEGAPGAYTNVLPTALGNDGTVLRNKSGEALGYADGCYLSGNATNAWQNVTYVGDDSSHFLTGFIHYTKTQAAAETPIYIKGVTIDTSQSHSRIAGYNNYDADSYHDPVKLSAGQVTVDKLGEKYYRLTPTASFVSTMGASTVGSDFRYIRLSLSGSGAGCVITIDEPIS